MKESARRRIVKRIGREVLVIGVVIAALFSARWSLADHYRIPTGSMVPTVHVNDRVVVNKASYGVRVPFTDFHIVEFEGPERGDVVVLDSPEDGNLLLKRVVGVPGDTILVSSGRLTINGEPAPVVKTDSGLAEKIDGVLHPLALTDAGGPDFGPAQLPDDMYLVMGDNRGNSRDGRIFGFVSKDTIRGKAMGVYYRSGLSWHDL